MITIEEHRRQNGEGKALNPKFYGKELPQLIDLLANSYGHINAIDKEDLPIPVQHRLAFAMNYLDDALRQLDIHIGNYKM